MLTKVLILSAITKMFFESRIFCCVNLQKLLAVKPYVLTRSLNTNPKCNVIIRKVQGNSCRWTKTHRSSINTISSIYIVAMHLIVQLIKS